MKKNLLTWKRIPKKYTKDGMRYSLVLDYNIMNWKQGHSWEEIRSYLKKYIAKFMDEYDKYFFEIEILRGKIELIEKEIKKENICI